MAQTLLTQVEDGIGIITLNRPDKRNALSIELRDELVAQLDAWAREETVRVVVIAGAGPSFCAGFDLAEFADPSLSATIAASSRAYHLAVWSFPKPTIAAVHGSTVAGGLDLATLCDIRIASDDAVFGHPEIKFGAPPLFTPMRWIVGDGRARELCLTGRGIDADEAQRIGLVSRVVPHDGLLTEALALARTIAEAPQTALEMTKSYLSSSGGKGFAESFLVEHDEVFARFLSGSVGPRA